MVFLAALASSACDQPPSGRDGGLDASDAWFIPEGAIFCDTDEQCDDGVECTVDSCGVDGICRFAPTQSMCDDGVFCNGQERCEPSLGGCAPPLMRETCNDDNVCTVDRCDEEADACIRTPRDLDEDGDVDWFCPGGGDCDDRDTSVSSLRNEVCGDFMDNDCDGSVDEATCGRPPHDVCDDPLDVSGGGFFMLSTSGAAADYASSCGGTRQDVVTTFTIDQPRSLAVTAEGDFLTVAVFLRETCTMAATELACESGWPAVLRRRRLEAGTYYMILATSAASPIALDVRFGDPSEPVTNDTCEAPTDIGAGGTFMDSFVDVDDDFDLGCGFEDSPEVVYTFTTEDIQDVRISAQSLSGSQSLTWELRSACDDASTALRCAYDAPAAGHVHELPAGTYFLIVEGPSWTEVDFRLDVEFLPATPAAPADQCSNAIPVVLGTPVSGTLADKEDDVDLACGFHYRDAVHTFTIGAPSDVTVELDTSSFANLAVRADCASEDTELVCTRGSRARLRGLEAGTYYVIAEASSPGGYSLRVDASPPVTPVDVSGNDDCGSAFDLPATGGLFRGNTTTLTNDYESFLCGGSGRDAAFRLTLSSTQRVVLSTEGSTFDTVLHVHRDVCTDFGDLHCDDDDGADGSTSFLDAVLDAGTYYVIVDGYGASAGEYFFEVTVRDP